MSYVPCLACLAQLYQLRAEGLLVDLFFDPLARDAPLDMRSAKWRAICVKFLVQSCMATARILSAVLPNDAAA